MVLSILLKFGALFIRPKTAIWAWGGLALVLAIGFAVWSLNTIDDLNRDKIEQVLKAENEQLERNNDMLKADQESMMIRMELLADAVESVNRKFSSNSRRRQQDYESMTGPSTPAGEAPNTSDLQDSANTGMNNLFRELETIGGAPENEPGS